MTARTFVIGDIHGDLAALERLLARLPARGSEDTLVFLGDYVDRGPDSLGVIRRVQALALEGPARLVALRGNHEDTWVDCFTAPNLGFLLQRSNGCAATFRSFTGGPALGAGEWLEPDELTRFSDVASWFPKDLLAWMDRLPLWYEDEHAIYVHAGLEGEGGDWKHPRDCAPKPMLWMREQDFFSHYRGKCLVFGHTQVKDLPNDHLGSRLFDDPRDVWRRGDLVGIDTGCGKGGFLSALELPSRKSYESR